MVVVVVVQVVVVAAEKFLVADRRGPFKELTVDLRGAIHPGADCFQSLVPAHHHANSMHLFHSQTLR